MTKELQDLAWSVLPKEFKEEVKFWYKSEYVSDRGYQPTSIMVRLDSLFGIHNLTSDAEGEEMLTVSRKKVQEIYRDADNLRKDPAIPHHAVYWNAEVELLQDLFGSKCLPDESESSILSKVENIGKDCKAEPKFHKGQRVRHKPTMLVDVIDGISQSAPYTYRFKHMVRPLREQGIFESDLEPYTEQTRPNYSEKLNSSDHIADARKMIDTIIKDSFNAHNRLHIATQITAAIYANYETAKEFKSIEAIVRKALDIADTLIKEAEKGDKQC